MELPIDPSLADRPGEHRIPAGVAVAAALAGEPAALADWVVVALKKKALRLCGGNERVASRMVKKFLSEVKVTVEFA